MIDDCKAGKIDMIIVKNIARFARNVVDCVATVRMLKALDKPVAVYFEDIYPRLSRSDYSERTLA